jgi:hypothetical protein
MLKAVKIINTCNHIVDEINNEIKLDNITRNGSQEFDMICPEYMIVYIDSVYQILNDGSFKIYYQDIDFIKYTTNKIKWISANLPQTGSTYYIEYQRSKREIKQYPQEDCPKCLGNGWHVRLTDDNDIKINTVTGFDKLVQDFIKILLTEKIDGYGSSMQDMLGQEIHDVNEFTRSIVNMVFQCETQYKAIQAELFNSGVQLDPLEKLNSVITTDCEYDSDFSSFFLSIIIVNESNKRAEVSLVL